MNLKILLIPIWEKSRSFKLMAFFVLEFRAIYWPGGGKHPLPPPGANMVKGCLFASSLNHMAVFLGLQIFIIL